MKITVLDAGSLNFEKNEWKALEPLGSCSIYDNTSYDAVVEACQGAEIALTNKVPFTRETLQQLPDLKLISVLATGYDCIDIEAARELGVTVCNVPGYSTQSTAQHAISLILELCNRVGLHDDSVQAGEWVDSEYFCYWKQAPLELTDLTVGIFGFGAIGRCVAEVLHVLGARIIASARTPKDAPAWEGFAWASPEALFEQSDILTFHCPLTAATQGIVNKKNLARMKKTAFVVNAARGGLVNEHDLAEALNQGVIAGAAVDVVSKEPMLKDCPLLGAKNCIITPHIAWASLRSRRELLAQTVRNIEAFSKGMPVCVVN